MKTKLLYTVATAMLLFGLLFVASPKVQAQANNPNGYIGRAHGVPGINDCIHNARNAGFQVNATVSQGVLPCLIPPCPVTYTVTFYGERPCPPNQICPLGPIVLVATVTFDEAGNVLSAQCGNSPL